MTGITVNFYRKLFFVLIMIGTIVYFVTQSFTLLQNFFEFGFDLKVIGHGAVLFGVLLFFVGTLFKLQIWNWSKNDIAGFGFFITVITTLLVLSIINRNPYGAEIHTSDDLIDLYSYIYFLVTGLVLCVGRMLIPANVE